VFSAEILPEKYQTKSKVAPQAEIRYKTTENHFKSMLFGDSLWL